MSWNNNAEGIQLPVNPESIEVKEQGQGKTYNIVGKGGGTDETRAGEVNVIQSPKLKEVSFSSVFPNQYYPFVNDEAPLFVPMYYIGYIRKWMESKHPIRFVFAGSYNALAIASRIKELSDLNFPASIESFNWKEVAGGSGDIEYTLQLKEYVFYSARRVKVGTDAAGNEVLIKEQPKRPDERIRPLAYKVKEGDNLISIAKRILDDDSRDKEIQKLNNLSDADVKKLAPGTVLSIPRN
ncbi:LysM peptidoglycan-binding domain-containing protein [Paenibacillus periandrae]|uniref:LysM peptidoglycan-binding domain-containing protein n=1 Tax=Paenibacillus periandrae TaxID=1761741 RepID=UPI001F08DAFC|nr:LysM peptidoglycan-binding domain-containing protein [Paenibacillus periandrae]